MFAWPSDSAGAPWMTRFFSELRRVGRPGDFSFLSFEWYPFDDVCAPTAPQLRVAPRRLLDGLRRLEAEGVPPAMPKVIAEYGYSAFAAQAQVSLPGALLDADIVGTFLGHGGSAAYLYGYEPTELDREPGCDAWGNNALFLSTPERRIRYRLATFFAMRMLTHHWLQPGDGEHAQLLVTTDAPTVNGDALVTAYAVGRPDGTHSVMLINKDRGRSYSARIRLGPGARLAPLLDEWQLSTAEYRWHPDGPRGHPSPDGPELHRALRSKDAIVLPPYSLTVLSERP
jgi:hypothetical protein